MRITGSALNPAAPTAATSSVAETEAAAATGPAAPSGPSGASAPLQSASLAPALAALRDMPEIDHARVAELRDALARGAVPFDPAKLAGLIERFHGGRG